MYLYYLRLVNCVFRYLSIDYWPLRSVAISIKRSHKATAVRYLKSVLRNIASTYTKYLKI